MRVFQSFAKMAACIDSRMLRSSNFGFLSVLSSWEEFRIANLALRGHYLKRKVFAHEQKFESFPLMKFPVFEGSFILHHTLFEMATKFSFSLDIPFNSLRETIIHDLEIPTKVWQLNQGMEHARKSEEDFRKLLEEREYFMRSELLSLRNLTRI